MSPGTHHNYLWQNPVNNAKTQDLLFFLFTSCLDFQRVLTRSKSSFFSQHPLKSTKLAERIHFSSFTGRSSTSSMFWIWLRLLHTEDGGADGRTWKQEDKVAYITQGYMDNGESTNGLIMIVKGTLFAKVYTVEAHLTDTLISRKLYLWPPSQNAVFLPSHTNYVFLHSRKRPAAATDTFFASWGCPIMRAFTVLNVSSGIVFCSMRRKSCPVAWSQWILQSG